METFCFESGTRIVLDKQRYRLLSEVVIDGVDCWELVALNTSTSINAKPIVKYHRQSDLEAWFALGRLAFDDERDDDTPEIRARRRQRRATPISDKPNSKRLRIMFRRETLKLVDERLGPGMTAAIVINGQRTTDTALGTTLAELGHTLGLKYYGKPKSISRASYYRWKAAYEVANDSRDLEGDFDKRGNRHPLMKLVKAEIRQVMKEKFDEAKKRKRGGKPTVTMNDIMVEAVKRIDAIKLKHPDLAQRISVPCKTTFYNILNKNFTAEAISLALHGRAKTRSAFRRPFGHEEPEACLSEVQYDETPLPFYCYDDILQIPLGRPWLAWLVDVFSAAIVGFYCGFEPPGDVVFTSVMRHAALPKAYVHQVYPDIDGGYPMAGFPRKTTFDNSLSAHGKTIEKIYSDLDLEYDFTGPRMPWLKGEVEGTFKDVNQSLLREMPGFVLSKEIDPADYDPTKNGAIGFLQLLWLLHHYIVLRHQSSPAGYSAAPNQLWEQGTRIIKPRLPRASADLDFMFGIVREGRLLDHRGVLFHGLRYYSEGVDLLRRRVGASIRVRIKVNPLNLGRVWVYDKDEDFWIECFALDRGYAEGLDLHRHTLYLRHAERLSGSTDLEARIRARTHLHEMIKDTAKEATSIYSNTLIARAAGIGTHSIFNYLDHQGNLSLLASQFATGSIPKPAETPVVSKPAAAPAQSAVPRQRELPVFAVDRSLRERQPVAGDKTDVR